MKVNSVKTPTTVTITLTEEEVYRLTSELEDVQTVISARYWTARLSKFHDALLAAVGREYHGSDISLK